MTTAADNARTRLATRLAFLSGGFSLASWAPLVPFAKTRIGLDDAGLGVVLLSLGIGSVVVMPLTGMLIARWGSKPMILGGGLGLVILLPVLAIANNEYLLAAALMGFGASLGTLDVAMNVHGIEVERAVGRPMMSGFHGLFSVGGFAGAGGMTFLLSVGATPIAGALCASGLTLAALGLARPRLMHAKGAPIPLVIPRGVVLLLAGLAAAAFLI